MKIWIKESALDEIQASGKAWLPCETGGILIGYRTENEYVVTQVIGPGANAKHGLMSFEPDQEYHEAEVARLYRESGRVLTYLGDWHTHPNSTAYLSGTDKQTAEKIASHKKARLPCPLMLVAAPPTDQYKIWTYIKNGKKSGIFTESKIVVYK